MPADSAPILDRLPFIGAKAQVRLAHFVEMLDSWQRAHNLVAPSTLDQVWNRHIADSAQLLPHAGSFQTWYDLGSGAGFPGLVVAVILAEEDAARFTLVEANQKKAAFLRAAIRETGANAAVVARRIESLPPEHSGAADIVSARALAPLAELCRFGAPLLRQEGRLMLLKGQGFEGEEAEAAAEWRYDAETIPSITDPGGRVVIIRRLARRAAP